MFDGERSQTKMIKIVQNLMFVQKRQLFFTKIELLCYIFSFSYLFCLNEIETINLIIQASILLKSNKTNPPHSPYQIISVGTFVSLCLCPKQPIFSQNAHKKSSYSISSKHTINIFDDWHPCYPFMNLQSIPLWVKQRPSWSKYRSADSFLCCMKIRDYKQSMRAKYILLLLALTAIVLAETAPKASRENRGARSSSLTWHELPPAGKRDADSIYKFVDHGLREKYWYYLTKACLIYVAAVERGDTYQFLAIYRNIVGTFLAITTWKNQSSTFDVNTLVRLGNGYAANSNANYKPVNLHLSHFRYSLGEGQYLIDVSDCGDVHLNGKELSNNLDDNLGKHHHYNETDTELLAKCKEFSEFTRKKFWYYLEDAHVVYSSVGSTAERNYCLITYVNIAGTFFVIGSDEVKTHKCEVNTFVRLGNGYDDDSEANYKPVNYQKVTLPLTSYED